MKSSLFIWNKVFGPLSGSLTGKPEMCSTSVRELSWASSGENCLGPEQVLCKLCLQRNEAAKFQQTSKEHAHY